MRVTNSATKIKKRPVTSLSLNYFTELFHETLVPVLYKGVCRDFCKALINYYI